MLELEKYPDLVQVLTLASPPLETVTNPNDAIGLAKIANDEMAELVSKYPEKFIAAVACLPLNDIDASLEEIDRAINVLGFKGIQMFTNINGEPLDATKFKPLYKKMAEYDLPIWIHPWDSPIMGSMTRDSPPSVREWVKEPFMGAIGWDFETSLAMLRLVNAGIFKDYPHIKFITHHCGGVVPMCQKRIGLVLPIEDILKFYNDTAVSGNTAGLMCGYTLFGPDKILFGTDMPLGLGKCTSGFTAETIKSIEEMAIPSSNKDRIFEYNARSILKL